MSLRGNCYDNAPMESFWGSLKNELVHHCRYLTRAEAKASITEYIELLQPSAATLAPGVPSPCRIYTKFHVRLAAAKVRPLFYAE